MAKFYPGEQNNIYFTVPNASGANTTGLTWTIDLFVKDGTKLTSGAEYTSITCVAVGSDFYRLRWTPDDNSVSNYTITMTSDASTPDFFEEVYTMDWDRLYFEADMDHDSSSPENVVYKLPGGSTISTFNLTRVGTVLSREKQ